MLNETGRIRPELFRVTVRHKEPGRAVHDNAEPAGELQLLILGRHALKELRDNLATAVRSGRRTGLQSVTFTGLFGENEETVYTADNIASAVRAIEFFRMTEIRIDSPAAPTKGDKHHD